jgi:hypothetical protein
VAAQTSEGTPLDLEQRLRLRRELRQAHRMRDGRGGDAPADGEGSGQTSLGGDREPSSDELNPSAHLEPTEVRRRAGPAHWAHDHPPGSGPHGFLLNPEERMHLRRQLREQGFAHRAAGAPPATAPQQPTP